MMIRSIGISPLRNIWNQFWVQQRVNCCTLEQKGKQIWCDKSRAEHEEKCRLEAHYKFQIGNLSPDPDKITADQWTHLFNLPSKNQRRKYLQHLYAKQSNSSEKKLVKEIRNEIIDLKKQAVLKERQENKHIIYGLGHDCLFLRFNRQQMAKWMNLRMHRAKLFGQKMIIDCGFDDRMTDREHRETAHKLEKVFADNRTHILPFDLYYFGGSSTNICLDRLTKQIPTLMKDSSMTKVHYDKCYTEIFPKNHLLMLTPDSPNVLEYNPYDIYVVGGIVDKGAHNPMTLAKAKRLNIRTARLPLEYLPKERQLNPEIPLDAVVNILRERQMKKDWAKILDEFVKKPEVKNDIVERRRYAKRRGSKILKYKDIE